MNNKHIETNNVLTDFIIGIADLKIRIITPSSGTYGYCIKYLTKGHSDYDIIVSEKDVQNEIKKSPLKGDFLNLAYLETVAVYRKIADVVLQNDIILMHGAVIAINNSAYMFSAPSRTGKTTHIKLWLNNLPGTFVVNGDKPLIKISSTQVVACGTPWCGKERMGTNAIVPLKAIIFMERAEDNYIDEITFPQAYPFLLQQTNIPDDPQKAKKALNLLSELYGKVRFYKFQFNNFKDDCFDVAYNTLVGSLEPSNDIIS